MLKYFKRQKSRNVSSNVNECNKNHNNNNITDVLDEVDKSVIDNLSSSSAAKRHSLRSTSSFCDEIFFEELSNLGLIASGGSFCVSDSCSEEDAVSHGASNSEGLINGDCCLADANAVIALNSIVEFDEGIFNYHSRLSMSVTTIVNEPNCLSYFIQYLEKRNALSSIKFYLDTENFKNAALAQLHKEQKHKLLAIKKSVETDFVQKTCELNTNNDTDDKMIQNKQHNQHYNELQETRVTHNSSNACEGREDGLNADKSIVPELKTLCDLTMRKPLTDDEKSQIYAQTNKHLKKSSDRNILKASSELSLCSLTSSLTEMSERVQMSVASTQDALTIYEKYLSGHPKQRIELPIDILSKISLLLCKKEHDDENSAITSDCFTEAQHFILNKLEKNYLNDFLQSTFYTKYCLELIQCQNLHINDILHSEVTLFYFMEYLEQHQERDCLDFWSSAINFRKSYLSQKPQIRNEKEAQSDAMIIYEKFFSLQNEGKLWSSNKLRSHVESCICTEGLVFFCFDLPLKVAAKYLEYKYLKSFLNSPLFANYLNELKSRTRKDIEHQQCLNEMQQSHKPLRRCVSDKPSNRHRKTLSDCTPDKKLSISQHNTLLASMDNHSSHLKQFQLNIDSSQLTNPNLLWHRSNSNKLKFGHVNALGRYERDFISPAEALQSNHNWSSALNGNKFKSAMRKLVNIPDKNVREEIAWQVAEMIVKDVTNVTMGKIKVEEQKEENKNNI